MALTIVVPFIRLFLELYDVHVAELPGITSSAVFSSCGGTMPRFIATDRRGSTSGGVVFMNHEE